MTIDDDCCMIGSANLENRSLYFDHEQNAIVIDTTLVNDFVEIYEADKQCSEPKVDARRGRSQDTFKGCKQHSSGKLKVMVLKHTPLGR